MRATQQKRQLPGNPHWTGTAQATSLPDKDAAHCNKRLILFSLDFPARQGCRRPRSSRIPYPKRHGGGLFAGRGRSTSHHRSRGSGIPHPSGGDTSPPKGKDRQRMARSAHDARFERSMQLGGAPWQDSHPMYDSRGLCGEKGPSLARSSRYAFPNGGLQRFSDTWRANIAKASSFWMHGGDLLPGKGAFPVRGPFRNA